MENKQPTIENELDNIIICNWKCEAFCEFLDSQLKNKLKSIENFQGTRNNKRNKKNFNKSRVASEWRRET